MTRTLILGVLALLMPVLAIHGRLPAEEKAPAKRIDVQQFDKMRHDKGTVVLDVRTKQEYEQGHVPDSTNIDINDPQFRKKIGELDHSKTYLVHCASGVRSDRAVRMMSSMGFSNLFDFHGGFKAWKQAGKPIEKGPEAGSK